MASQLLEILSILKQQAELIEVNHVIICLLVQVLRSDQEKLKAKLGIVEFNEKIQASNDHDNVPSIISVNRSTLPLKLDEMSKSIVDVQVTDKMAPLSVTENLDGIEPPIEIESSNDDILMLPMLADNAMSDCGSNSPHTVHGIENIGVLKRELLRKRSEASRIQSRKQFGLSNPVDDMLDRTNKMLDENRPWSGMRHCKSAASYQTSKTLPRIKSSQNLFFVPSNESCAVPQLDTFADDEQIIVENRKFNAMDSSTAVMQSDMSSSLWENELSRRILTLYDATTKIEPKLQTMQYSTLNQAKSSKSIKSSTPEKAVRVPERRYPIWFKADGLMKCDWSVLPGGEGLTKELETLEESLDYRRYIAIVETLLTAKWRTLEDASGVCRLWEQMIMVLKSFMTRLIDAKKHDCGMELYRKGMTLCGREDILGRSNRQRMEAQMQDSYAYLFFMKKKYKASMSEVVNSVRTFNRLRLWYNYGICLIHKAAIQSHMKSHQESINTLHEILHMLEDEKISVADDASALSAEYFCMIAIVYHNLATEEFNLQNYTNACDLSQNAMKLARNCLSCSSKWLKWIDTTHERSVTQLSEQYDGSNLPEIYDINVAGQL